MIDIKLIRENPDLVKENIKKKFQDEKLGLVDKVKKDDEEIRDLQTEGDKLKADKNRLNKEIGSLMRDGKKDEAEKIKTEIANINKRIDEIDERFPVLQKDIKEAMMTIPNIIADDVPIGKDDSENVDEAHFGDPVVPKYGDIARLHSAVLAYARDFMIDKGFTYCIPPFMIHSDAVDGVMSFAEKENMMYKIEGEDLYLIGTSEHSMIAKFKDQIIDEKELPITMTSYSPCFRKEVGAHGIEERGIYRIHQFEKQEMVVLCKGEESDEWYEKMWNYSVELFRSLDIPVRQLTCCSGDLADLKYRSCDIEAWSPRQQKYFEVCSCSNLTDAQARRLAIRYKKENGDKELVHTLNNTVIAPPRMLIALLENNYNEDGSVTIPVVLRPYMGGKEKLEVK